MSEPDSEAAITSLTERLSGGNALTMSDIGEVIIKHGYSRGTAHDVIRNVGVRKALEAQGINLQSERYGKFVIFWDGNIPTEETDLAEKKQLIDAEARKSSSKARETRRRRGV